MSLLKKHLAVLAVLMSATSAWAASSTTLTDDAVASVGSTYYTDLQEALTALEFGTSTNNYQLTVLKDVTLADGLVFEDTKASGYPSISGRCEYYIIDLNGHTLTLANGENPVLTVKGEIYSSLRVQNGTLAATGTTPGAFDATTFWLRVVDVTMRSESAAATCRSRSANRNFALKGCSVENTATGGVAVEIGGDQGLVHSSTLVGKGTALVVKQTKSLSTDGKYCGGVAVAASTLDAPVAVKVDSSSLFDVYLTGGTIKGALVDDSVLLHICGGTYTADPSEYIGSGYTVIDDGNGTYAVSDAEAVAVDGVNTNMVDAFNLTGVAKRSLKLNGDVFLVGLEGKKDMISVGQDQDITIDLNGHDLMVFDVSASFSNVNCASVKNNGKLTITDSSEGKSGGLSFAAWLMDIRQTPGFANNMFTLSDSSVLNLEAGTIENVSVYKAGWSKATYCVDVSGSATLNVKGGKILHTNTAIRLFNGNTIVMTMTDGEVYSGNSTLWVQGGKVDVSITGGKLVGLVNDGSYGSIYTSSSPSGQVLLGGTLESIGNIYSFSPTTEYFIKITGGTFIDDGSGYGFYGSPGKNAMEITGGVFAPCYMYYHNYMKYWTGYEDYYLKVDGTLRIEEDERYHFGEPVAQLLDVDGMAKPYSQVQRVVYENYSSLPLALSHAGEWMYVAQTNLYIIAWRAELVADDPDAKPHVFEGLNNFAGVNNFEVRLNGHKVTSAATDPLVMLTRLTVGALVFADEGTIQSAGPVFGKEIDADNSAIAIYDGLFLTTGETLFEVPPEQLWIPANTAVKGEPFDLNRAGFSHDVSGYVVNAANVVPFVTRQSKTDHNWYIARRLKAE